MNARQTTIEQLTETLRHLRDVAPHLELEVRVTDYANAAYQCRLRLTREGVLFDGPEGDQPVERTADPLAIALQIRDSADEARARVASGTWFDPSRVVVRVGDIIPEGFGPDSYIVKGRVQPMLPKFEIKQESSGRWFVLTDWFKVDKSMALLTQTTLQVTTAGKLDTASAGWSTRKKAEAAMEQCKARLR